MQPLSRLLAKSTSLGPGNPAGPQLSERQPHLRLRVATFCRLDYQGTEYRAGHEFDVSDESAPQWLRTGLVVPADGIWPEDAAPPPKPPAVPAESRPTKPAAKPGEYVAHDPCEADPRPKGKRLSRAVCSVAGCPCMTWGGECAECKRVHNRHRTRKREHKAYQGKEWQRTRREYLRAHPLCECDNCVQIAVPLRPAASVVDHIDGLGALGPRAHDWSNLRAMTKRCHDRRTMRDQVHGM